MLWEKQYEQLLHHGNAQIYINYALTSTHLDLARLLVSRGRKLPNFERDMIMGIKLMENSISEIVWAFLNLSIYGDICVSGNLMESITSQIVDSTVGLPQILNDCD